MQPNLTMLRELFDRADSRCECRLPLCRHQQRCTQPLQWDEYGSDWRVLNMMLSEDTQDPENWLVLCSHCAARWPGGLESRADAPLSPV